MVHRLTLNAYLQEKERSEEEEQLQEVHFNVMIVDAIAFLPILGTWSLCVAKQEEETAKVPAEVEAVVGTTCSLPAVMQSTPSFSDRSWCVLQEEFCRCEL